MVCLWYASMSSATSIIPYSNLGELAQQTNNIVLAYVVDDGEYSDGNKTYFRYTLEIEDVIKGDLSITDDIFLQRYSHRESNLERKVFGDIVLEVGKSYLLFLNHMNNNIYRPQVMNYYVFEEIDYRDGKILAPTQESSELQIIEEQEVEPLKVYHKNNLVKHLKDINSGKTKWILKNVISPFQNIKSTLRSQQPSHCNNYYFRNPTRWQLFDKGGILPIYADSDPDLEKNNSNKLVQKAIDALGIGYQNSSVQLSYGGDKNFDPCITDDWYDVSATGYNFQNWAKEQIGEESIYIMFNDPCGELNEFSCGKKGTIAFGGLYRSIQESHEHNGEKFYNGYLGFVLMAKGAGCISDSRFTSVLMHEITHALSLGHIHGAGTALMNSGCCGPVSHLDSECIEYLYPPLEKEEEKKEEEVEDEEVIIITEEAVHSEAEINRIVFKANSKSKQNQFVIEKSNDGVNFSLLSVLSQAQKKFNKLEIIDRTPFRIKTYYRISVVNGQGSEMASKYISSNIKSQLAVSPNPINSNGSFQITIKGNKGQSGELSIVDVTGQVKYREQIYLEQNEHVLDKILPNLNQGTYYTIWKDDLHVSSHKFIK